MFLHLFNLHGGLFERGEEQATCKSSQLRFHALVSPLNLRLRGDHLLHLFPYAVQQVLVFLAWKAFHVWRANASLRIDPFLLSLVCRAFPWLHVAVCAVHARWLGRPDRWQAAAAAVFSSCKMASIASCSARMLLHAPTLGRGGVDPSDPSLSPSLHEPKGVSSRMVVLSTTRFAFVQICNADAPGMKAWMKPCESDSSYERPTDGKGLPIVKGGR